jgi:hypothetical protein
MHLLHMLEETLEVRLFVERWIIDCCTSFRNRLKCHLLQLVLNNWFTFSSPGVVSSQCRRELFRDTPVHLEGRIIRKKDGCGWGSRDPRLGLVKKRGVFNFPPPKKGFSIFSPIFSKRCLMVEQTDTGWMRFVLRLRWWRTKSWSTGGHTLCLNCATLTGFTYVLRVVPTNSVRLRVSLASSMRLTMTIRRCLTPTTLSYRYSRSLTNETCSSRVSGLR